MLRNEIIHQIVNREMQGHMLTEEAAQEDAPDLHQSACEQFGTWETALRYAGLIARSLYGCRNYTREGVLRKIRKYCQTGGKPTAKNVCRGDYRLQEAAQREFETWRQALLAAGVDLRLAGLGSRRSPRLSQEKILDTLRAWSAEGHSLRWCKVCMENRVLAVAARGKFGSWRRAIMAAGLGGDARPAANRQEWDPQRVIDSIRDRQQAGKPINYRAVRKDDSSLLAAARRRFGGWRDAIAAAGVAPTASAKRSTVHPSLIVASD